MSKRSTFLGLLLICAALLIAAGLSLSAESTTSWLLTGTTALDERLVAQGVVVFKWLLVIDGLILLAIAIVSARIPSSVVDETQQHPGQPFFVEQSLADEKRWPWMLAIILMLSLVLRLYQLNSDLWIDEVLTLVNYVRLPVGAVWANFEDDNQHLLFSLLARVSVVMFGESAWSLRLPAMLAGIASIALTGVLALKLFGVRVAVLSAMLLCVSWHHIWYSQNARGYTLLLCGTVLATWCLLRALETGSWRAWLGYAAAVALSVMAHLTGVFIAIAHAIVVLPLFAFQRRSFSHWYKALSSFLLSGWLTLHCYALAIPQLINFFLPEEPAAAKLDNPWRSPLWLINETLRSLGLPFSLGWLELMACLLAGLFICWMFRRKNWLFLLLAVLPGVTLGLCMVLMGRNLWPRLFFNLAGFIVIFMAVACFFTGQHLTRLLKLRSAWWQWVPGALLVLVFAQSLVSLYRFPKQDFTGARDFVMARAGPLDNVLGIHMAGKIYKLYYEPSWDSITTLEQLNAQRSTEGSTWIIYTLENYLKKSRPELYQELVLHAELVREFPGTLGDGDMIVRRFQRTDQTKP